MRLLEITSTNSHQSFFREAWLQPNPKYSSETSKIHLYIRIFSRRKTLVTKSTTTIRLRQQSAKNQVLPIRTHRTFLYRNIQLDMDEVNANTGAKFEPAANHDPTSENAIWENQERVCQESSAGVL